MKTKILASILAAALTLSALTATAITASAIDDPFVTDTVYDIDTATTTTKPQITVTAGNKQAAITWSAVSGATKYAVYSYINGGYTQHTVTTSTSYTVTELANDTRYGFLVRALINDTWSEYTDADLVYATPSSNTNKPTNVKVAAGNKQATVTWDAVKGATKYVVYSYTDGKYAQLGTCTTTSYTATGLTNGKKYGFLVKSLVNSVWSTWSDADLVYTIPSSDANKPQNVKIAAGNKRAVITWDEVPGATKYVIYRYISEGKGMQLSTCATNRYIATRLTNGTKYGFFVKSLVNGVWSEWDEADVVYVTPKA